MATQKAIEPTLAALQKEICTTLSLIAVPASSIEVRWLLFDYRIGKDCWAVSVDGWGILGWLSQPLQDHPCIDPRTQHQTLLDPPNG